MTKDIWKRFRKRNSQVLKEVAQIEMEMAQRNPRKGPTIFPGIPARPAHIVYFMLLVLLACMLWVLTRHAG